MSSLSLDDGFSGSIPQTDDDVAVALKGGLVSLDANVLLSFYRYTPNARQALIDVLTAVGDRLWVSHQAAREFWRNRPATIDDRDAATDQVGVALDKAEASAIASIDTWAKLTAVPAGVKQAVKDSLSSAFTSARALIDEEVSEAGAIAYDASNDTVVDALRGLLAGRVGQALPDQEHDAALIEAQRRVENQIPPGYRDAEKADGPDGAAGDYLVWLQSMNEASSRNLPLVIVTGDEKEDWWWKHRSTFMGPRAELVAEFGSHCNHDLYMLRPFQMIEHAAVLDVVVSEEAASDVARATRSDDSPTWTRAGVLELLRRLETEGLPHASVIRQAVREGGVISRGSIYEICGFDADRMLRGFTKPTARVTRDLQAEGLLDPGVEPMLTPIYVGVIAESFSVPDQVVEVLSVSFSRSTEEAGDSQWAKSAPEQTD